MVSISKGRTELHTLNKESDYVVPEDYQPYVPVAKRRKQLLSKLEAKKNNTTEEVQKQREVREREEIDHEEREREKMRRERTLLQQAQEVKERKALEGTSYS
jgi:ATP-dependent RNA helicase DDX41